MIFRNNIFKTFLFIAAFFCVAVYGDTYRVVTSANFPPYEYYARGSIVGIDIEIIREAFFRNGHDVIVEDMKFDSIIASIQTGKGAVAASGITVTEDRKKMVDFTIPYVSAKQVIIVPKNSPIKKAADLYNGKWRIGVQHGTTGDLYVKDNIQEKNIQNTVKTPKSNGGTYKLVTGILMILLSLFPLIPYNPHKPLRLLIQHFLLLLLFLIFHIL
jgi:ABC-type amino acid transport substrate-binding protein